MVRKARRHILDLMLSEHYGDCYACVRNNNCELQALAKDQEHLAHLGTMGASVAHEIRNPLSIIEGSNELIRKKYGKKDEEILNIESDKGVMQLWLGIESNN